MFTSSSLHMYCLFEVGWSEYAGSAAAFRDSPEWLQVG
jgi:hypothetical protein